MNGTGQKRRSNHLQFPGQSYYISKSNRIFGFTLIWNKSQKLPSQLPPKGKSLSHQQLVPEPEIAGVRTGSAQATNVGSWDVLELKRLPEIQVSWWEMHSHQRHSQPLEEHQHTKHFIFHQPACFSAAFIAPPLRPPGRAVPRPGETRASEGVACLLPTFSSYYH